MDLIQVLFQQHCLIPANITEKVTCSYFYEISTDHCSHYQFMVQHRLSRSKRLCFYTLLQALNGKQYDCDLATPLCPQKIMKVSLWTPPQCHTLILARLLRKEMEGCFKTCALNFLQKTHLDPSPLTGTVEMENIPKGN